MAPSLFISHMEVRPRADCEVLNPHEVGGAFVRCYTKERSLEDALARFRSAADALGLAVVEIHWIVNDDHTDWESPGDEEAERLAQEARASDEVVFGEFQAWAVAAPNALN